MSSGILGLIAAIDNFDPAHNVKLRTYAEYKIRGAILDSLRKLDWASRDRRRKTKQIEAAILAAEQRLRRAAVEEEIAAELQLDLKEYREWQLDILGLNLNSLDYTSDHEDGRNLLDTVADNEEHWPSNLLESSELERLLAAAMERMPPVERTVLCRYYQEELTLREIAQGMNLHLSRISQLKSQAILRLRSFLEKRWPPSAADSQVTGPRAAPAPSPNTRLCIVLSITDAKRSRVAFSRAGLALKLVVLRRSIAGASSTSPRVAASPRTPRRPVTRRPRPAATRRAAFSSSRMTSAFMDSAKRMAACSPA